MLQAELLYRTRKCETPPAELEALMVTIAGIAAGNAKYWLISDSYYNLISIYICKKNKGRHVRPFYYNKINTNEYFISFLGYLSRNISTLYLLFRYTTAPLRKYQ
ncbi:hypothetical protein O9992_07675 [Vibrio lentus]|nr:hypothetical protein [Vibrio lentus]